MRNSRSKDAPGGAAGAWLRADRGPLAIAAAVSLLAHLSLLFAWRVQHENTPREPAFVVTLTGALVAPRAPRPERTRPAVQAPEHAVERPVAKPATKSARRQQPVVASRSAAVPSPPAAAPERPHRDDATLARREQQLTQGPVPQTAPDAEAMKAAKLVGRRLRLKLWIAADGTVSKAEVVPYEISPETAALLQEAVAAVRFTPARADGQPVAAQVESRLCFDQAGQLDTSSPECWQFDPPPAR